MFSRLFYSMIFRFFIVCVLTFLLFSSIMIKISSADNSETVVVKKSFLIKINMELLKRRRTIAHLRISLAKKQRDEQIERSYCAQRVLAERAICNSRETKTCSCSHTAHNIAIAACIAAVVASGAGGYHLGKTTR